MAKKRLMNKPFERKLNEGELSELDDLFDGTSQGITQMAKLFKVSKTCIKYTLNWKGFADRHKLSVKAYRSRNKEKLNILQRKYHKEYRTKNPEKIREITRRSYQKNKEKLKEYYRLRYIRTKGRLNNINHNTN